MNSVFVPTRISLLLIVFLFLALPIRAADQYVAGEAIVKIAPGGPDKNAFSALGVSIRDSIPDEQLYLVEFPDDRTVSDIVKALGRTPSVEFAQPNHAYELPEVQQISIGFPDQNRPVFNFGTKPPDYYGQPGVYTTGLDSAQLLADGSGVRVAVIDNGLAIDHPLMAYSTILNGRDFVDGDGDPGEESGLMYGHGTFVTGLVLLAAPGSEILPLRAFDGDGVGSEFAIVQALNWALARGADVINMSFGSYTIHPAMQATVNRVIDRGVVLVAASGNYGSDDPVYPAAIESVIAVGSFGEDELVADFSSFGEHLDLVAPGVDVYSALAGEYEWGTWSGTSFSAPLVSGSVALMLQRAGAMDANAIEKHLRQTARTELLWGTVETPDAYYGWGALDAYAAVAELSKGDLDNSGAVGFEDLRILSNLAAGFEGGGAQNGNQPNLPHQVRMRLADLTCDGIVDDADVEALRDYLFLGGEEPCTCPD
ncbi:S8 family serine peptidase [candidate division GN15 bacterium]|nr:S8 family serine peptidase [candidate division GN15 bacterium]